MGKVVALAETRGCPGKTLIGLNLALALSWQVKEKTAFLDLSFSGDKTVETLLSFGPGKPSAPLLPCFPALTRRC